MLTMQCGECHLPGFMKELSSSACEHERFECENVNIISRDGSGRKVMHAAALEDLKALEQEMLLTKSCYIRKE